MEQAEVQAVAQQIKLLNTIIVDMDLSEFLDAITTHEILGPILDPTAWIKNEALGTHQLLGHMKFCAGKLLEIQKRLKQIQAHENQGQRP